MISFKVSKDEMLKIRKLSAKAVSLAEKIGVDYKMTDIAMDLTACHANGCKLKLEELLSADEFNFAHDVFGIRRHLDRDTGELKDCFLPRFAA